MKKLTDIQKKWALTACLTTVLSFNLVMNLADTNYQSTNLASSSAKKKDEKKYFFSRYGEEVSRTLAADLFKIPEPKPAKKSAKKPGPRVELANTASEPAAESEPGETADAESEPTKTVIEDKGTNTRRIIISSEDGKRFEVLVVKKENDEEIEAIIPKMTESGFCPKCGSSYLLPGSFNQSANDIAKALVEKMNQDIVKSENVKEEVASTDEEEDLEPKVASRKKQKPVEEDEEEDEEEEAPKENAEFAKLKQKCDKKDDNSRLDCFASGLTNLLKDTAANRKKGTFDKDEVLAFFEENIQAELASGLRDLSDRGSLSRNQFDPFVDLELEDPRNSRRNKAQKILETMIAGISKKYNYLRQKLTDITASAVFISQAKAQDKLKKAEMLKQSNPGAALRLQSEGMNSMNSSFQLASQLDSTLSGGLSSALLSNLINQDQFDNLYQDKFATRVSEAIQGLSQNPLTYVIPSTVLSSGLQIVDGAGNQFTLTPSAGTGIQQRVVGRGTPVMNGLTPINGVPQGAPRIVTLSGISPQPGTVTIQPIQGGAVQAPTQFQAIQAPTLQNSGVPRLGR